jgi:hypothetical protein
VNDAQPARKDYAAIWRAVEAQTFERTFGGLPCLVRRIRLSTWLSCGHMPQYLVELTQKSLDGEEESLAETELTPEQKKEFAAFQCYVVCQSVVEPRIVEGEAQSDDEISYSRLKMDHPRFIFELYEWVTKGAIDVPVHLEGGESVSVESLTNFRAESASSGAGNDSQDVRTAPVADDRD